jgi:hypothetical protein
MKCPFSGCFRCYTVIRLSGLINIDTTTFPCCLPDELANACLLANYEASPYTTSAFLLRVDFDLNGATRVRSTGADLLPQRSVFPHHFYDGTRRGNVTDISDSLSQPSEGSYYRRSLFLDTGRTGHYSLKAAHEVPSQPGRGRHAAFVSWWYRSLRTSALHLRSPAPLDLDTFLS